MLHTYIISLHFFIYYKFLFKYFLVFYIISQLNNRYLLHEIAVLSTQNSSYNHTLNSLQTLISILQQRKPKIKIKKTKNPKIETKIINNILTLRLYIRHNI